MAAKDHTAIVLLGKWLESKYDIQVGEHPAFGGVDPGVHVPTSNHNIGAAIDVNHDQGGESEALNEIYDLLASQAQDLNIAELYFENRGIPSPVAGHDDHMHIAILGPPTGTLLRLVGGIGDTPLGGFDDAITGAAGDAAGFVGDQATAAAKAMVTLILDSLGEDGARILLYIALVVGGASLTYYGIARAAGVQSPVGTPLALAVRKGR